MKFSEKTGECYFIFEFHVEASKYHKLYQKNPNKSIQQYANPNRKKNNWENIFVHIFFSLRTSISKYTKQIILLTNFSILMISFVLFLQNLSLL